MLIFKSLSKESINYASCSEQEKAYFEQIMKRFYEIKQNVRDNDKNGLISPKQMSVWLSYFIKFEDIYNTYTRDTSDTGTKTFANNLRAINSRLVELEAMAPEYSYTAKMLGELIDLINQYFLYVIQTYY